MARKKRNKATLTSLAVLIVLLAGIGTVALIKTMTTSRGADQTITDTAHETTNDTTPDTGLPEATDGHSTNNEAANETPDASDTPSAPALDPATVGSIDIEPLELTVSYVKGINGFEFEVLRTARGTRYVEFRSPDLIGTKCTDDEGTFASILENPTDDEAATISNKTTVDGQSYGLSLAGASCTSDTKLLANYQESFTDAFTLLKKME